MIKRSTVPDYYPGKEVVVGKVWDAMKVGVSQSGNLNIMLHTGNVIH